jgi:hypothetical protein
MKVIGIAGRLAITAALAGRALCADPAEEKSRKAIAAIKEYQESLGLKPTGNFRKHT